MRPGVAQYKTLGSNPGTSLHRASTEPLPSAPGTYILILQSSAEHHVTVGALGILELNLGFYAYVGSALGPGGLRARLAYHCGQVRSPHWHIDYLRRHTTLREIWFSQGASDREHRWAEALEADTKAGIPLARFGASDCACRSHLFQFQRRPRVAAFQQTLGARPAVARWVAA